MKHTLLTFIVAACCSFSAWAADHTQSIVPKPQSLTYQDGTFVLNDRCTVSFSPQLRPQAEWLTHELQRSTGYSLTLKDRPAKGGISLVLDSALVSQPEGYTLAVTKKGITVTAHDNAGAYYALQTLLQLFPASVRSSALQPTVQWAVPCVTVSDAPAHPYRGYMLDAGRNYYDLSFLKKCVDWMSAYKLNKLQLHLIDDSGWRLEIKKYPRLTSVGAWAGKDEARTGGYYTQSEMRELVSYAQVRGVEVIPEIEFPAHVLSAIVAYPWLSCTGKQHEVPTQHFISDDLLCVGKDSVMQFLRDVLDETMDIFPSRYVNIGGDEAVYTKWESCPRCQSLMKREGLTEASQLQGYLTNVVTDYLSQHGRTAIGWEEALMRGRLNKPIVGMMWHEAADTIKAKDAGCKAVVASSNYMYFDFPETGKAGEVYGATWLPPFGVEHAYSLPLEDYSPYGTTLGVQGCMWSDRFIIGPTLHVIPNLNENRATQYVEHLTFPRLLALSEVAWTAKAQRGYADFSERLKAQFPRLDYMGCNYRVPEPAVKRETPVADGLCEFVLSCPVEGATVRYTTDGSWPTVHSEVYEEGSTVRADRRKLRAITVVTPTHYSLPMILEGGK